MYPLEVHYSAVFAGQPHSGSLKTPNQLLRPHISPKHAYPENSREVCSFTQPFSQTKAQPKGRETLILKVDAGVV
jgi:hypothetical protein